MNKISTYISKGAVALTLAAMAVPANAVAQEKVTGWGDFKIYLDPGHSGRENQGLWGYSEAQKTLRVALGIQDLFFNYTDMPQSCLKLCRYNDNTTVSLEDRSDEANAWGADFYYSIHSDAGTTNNSILLLFGGWRKNGVEIEKTPNGGKHYGELLEPNLSGAMRINSRGNWYDRCYYDKSSHHTNQYPYLSVNRRSNMPSLLSEGGFHTIAEQQQVNINDDYKKLESLAAFHSLMQYNNMKLPLTTTLAGIVRNGENNEPINGVTVSVDGRSYTTDTWESVFKLYSNNPDLIHNGFYYFEGLTAGQTYEITFKAEGYEDYTTTATIKSGGEHTADFITFADVNLTNIAPAKVSSISLDNLSAVSPLQPLAITFSRIMDRESVEKAVSVSYGHHVGLSWRNNYTLLVDLSELEPDWDYTLKIDGSIAKNSATQQLLDGDGDGVAGGDYLLDFTMAEPDTEAPYIVKTYPETNGEAVFNVRPVIGIEFNEELAWNDDNFVEAVTVSDKDGNVYPGKLTHAVINKHSVLQYYLSADLPRDCAILVTVQPGLVDLYGNTAEGMFFKFLTEYRAMKSFTLLNDFTSVSDWFTPGGSGSTKGLIIEDSTLAVDKNLSSALDGDNCSARMVYVFDQDAATPLWNIREYWKSGVNAANAITDPNAVITAQCYGDCSNNTIGIRCRVNTSGGGIKYRDPEFVVDFGGWRTIYWDLKNDKFAAFTGSETSLTKWMFDSFFMIHQDTDPDDEEIPFQAWEGAVNFDTLGYSTWDHSCTRTARLDDVEDPKLGVAEIEANGAIMNHGDRVSVVTTAQVNTVNVYNLAGSLVATANGSSVSTAHLGSGVYIVRAATKGGNVVGKIVR